MSHQKLLTKLEGFRSRNSQNHCYICGNPHQHIMFHGKNISLLHMPYSNIIKDMIRINRRQICLCQECFTKVSQNLLEYNQITKRKLT